jgi:phage terminase small subunit
MSKHAPRWLSALAKDFWLDHHSLLHLQPEQEETFAVLCETYADYRNALDFSKKKQFLELYCKLCQQFRLTPKTQIKIDTTDKADELDQYFAK